MGFAPRLATPPAPFFSAARLSGGRQGNRCLVVPTRTLREALSVSNDKNTNRFRPKVEVTSPTQTSLGWLTVNPLGPSW